MRATPERLSAHEASCFSRYSDRKEDFSIERALADRVITVVRQVDGVVRSHVNSVGALEHAISPRAQVVPVAVEHHHRMIATMERVDAIVAVDTDRRNVAELPRFRPFDPILEDAILVVAAAEDCGHAVCSRTFTSSSMGVSRAVSPI